MCDFKGQWLAIAIIMARASTYASYMADRIWNIKTDWKCFRLELGKMARNLSDSAAMKCCCFLSYYMYICINARLPYKWFFSTGAIQLMEIGDVHRKDIIDHPENYTLLTTLDEGLFHAVFSEILIYSNGTVVSFGDTMRLILTYFFFRDMEKV